MNIDPTSADSLERMADLVRRQHRSLDTMLLRHRTASTRPGPSRSQALTREATDCLADGFRHRPRRRLPDALLRVRQVPGRIDRPDQPVRRGRNALVFPARRRSSCATRSSARAGVPWSRAVGGAISRISSARKRPGPTCSPRACSIRCNSWSKPAIRRIGCTSSCSIAIPRVRWRHGSTSGLTRLPAEHADPAIMSSPR